MQLEGGVADVVAVMVREPAGSEDEPEDAGGERRPRRG